ncbi:Retrotransposon gag domain [Cinara cedri]|uniref:Retrotransposon gag domain n=1 Tax=Cinara cedri TaxID=506608 RepID=A0A5E4MIY2_9HEMI|nr:Retrotransposon gag domain [Cinara cedri]
MSELEQDNQDNTKLPIIDFTAISTTWVHKLTKDKLIIELSRLNLITTGLVADLKARLLRYLRGENNPEVFISEKTKNNCVIAPESLNKIDKVKINPIMSDNKRPYFKQGNFSGAISENIDTFLKKYNRAAFINGWSETDKTQFISVFFLSTFYDNLQYSSDKLEWEDIENKLRLEFEPIDMQTDMLRMILEKRKQLPDEQTVAYINDAESLCRRIDNQMPQEEMIRNIMKGLKPSIARYIGIMGNETLAELKKNVRKYEMVEFMITEDTPKTPFDIETETIQSKIQQINKDNSSKKPEIDRLREEVENLK